MATSRMKPTAQKARPPLRFDVRCSVTHRLLWSPYQDAERSHQRRSFIAQKLKVPKRTPRLFARCGLAGRTF